jgi:hypothetical protein
MSMSENNHPIGVPYEFHEASDRQNLILERAALPHVPKLKIWF